MHITFQRKSVQRSKMNQTFVKTIRLNVGVSVAESVTGYSGLLFKPIEITKEHTKTDFCFILKLRCKR